jgi:hypothetical protein
MGWILKPAAFWINAYNPATQFGRTEQSRPKLPKPVLRRTNLGHLPLRKTLTVR